jgi:N4-gp56 family major capsid protein
MGTNSSSQFSADIVAYIQKEVLPLTQRQLIAYQFGDPLELPEGRGTTYTGVRYNRVPLPFAPLSEGVPPVGETMTISTVVATAQQWGDSITITDVTEITVFHPVFQQAINILALQVAETFERNTYVTLNSGVQIQYANGRTSRATLTTGDVMSAHEINKVNATLMSLGAPQFMGQMETDEKQEADSGGSRASDNPRRMPHYTALIHPVIAADLREDTTIKTAWQYSDINRLYNYEVGEWNGVRFCQSNMVPSWTGVATVGSGTVGTAGSLATAADYYIQVTGSDTQNQYESLIYQISSAITTVVGPNGSISLTTPATAGYTYNVYIGTTTSLANLATSASGPTSGPLQGMAVQLPPSTTVVLTGIGVAQVPPAAPATAITVYPTYVIGRGAYGQVKLKDVEYTYLTGADKSDKLNQLRVVGWKTFYGTLIQNQIFFARIESVTAFPTTFPGTPAGYAAD